MKEAFDWHRPPNPDDFVADFDTLSVTFKPLGMVFRPVSARRYGVEGRLTVMGPSPEAARLFAQQPDGLGLFHAYCLAATEKYIDVVRALLWLQCDLFDTFGYFFVFQHFPYDLDMDMFEK